MSLLMRATRLAAVARPLVRGELVPRTLAASRSLASVAYPSDRKYRKSHEWVKMDGDVATVGITDFATGALGEIVFVDLPRTGRVVESAEGTAAVESVKAAGDIYAPISGEVVEVNEKLGDSPELLNEDPHEKGWIFRLKVSDASEVDQLLDSVAYSAILEEKKK